ncbi:hypothetical protein TruAng_007103 [Truncatella angustata]|nr:hypothetical protein TruAng_007103 [Truncatella angustata]
MSDRRRYQRAHPRQGRSVRNRLEDQHEGSNDYDLTANQTYALGTDDSAELADEDHGFPHQMNTPLATFYSPAQVENDDQSMEESATVWQNYSHSGARFDAHYTTSWSFMTPRTSAWDFAPHGHSAGGYLQPFVNEPDSLEGSGDGNGREAPESGGSFSSNEAEQGSVVE